MSAKTAQIERAALELGFARVGFGSVEPFIEGRQRLERWLAAGLHAGLDYMAGSDDRAEPRGLLAGARSYVAVALAHPTPRPREQADPSRGTVAAYARGQDYHLVMKQKLGALAEAMSRIVGRPVLGRACVDSAPLLEREAAARAGIGFVGKSTLLIAPGVGTNVLLGELLTDVELEPSVPLAAACGSCRACLDACPTGAFVEPWLLDAGRCISFLTIEHRASIPRALRSAIGQRVFGCDACQEVCPFDASTNPEPHAPELAGRIAEAGLPLIELLEMGNAGYRKLVRRTALRRVNRDVLARNAAVALGNSLDPSAVDALARAVERHPSGLVRAHAAWALGRLGGATARAALERARNGDPEREVQSEAALALAELDDRERAAYRS